MGQQAVMGATARHILGFSRQQTIYAPVGKGLQGIATHPTFPLGVARTNDWPPAVGIELGTPGQQSTTPSEHPWQSRQVTFICPKHDLRYTSETWHPTNLSGFGQ